MRQLETELWGSAETCGNMFGMCLEVLSIEMRVKEIASGKEEAKRGHSQRWRPGEAHDVDLRACGAAGFTTDVEF